MFASSLLLDTHLSVSGQHDSDPLHWIMRERARRFVCAPTACEIRDRRYTQRALQERLREEREAREEYDSGHISFFFPDGYEESDDEGEPAPGGAMMASHAIGPSPGEGERGRGGEGCDDGIADRADMASRPIASPVRAPRPALVLVSASVSAPPPVAALAPAPAGLVVAGLTIRRIVAMVVAEQAGGMQRSKIIRRVRDLVPGVNVNTVRGAVTVKNPLIESMGGGMWRAKNAC